MKKSLIVFWILTIALLAGGLSANAAVVKVGATAVPHGEILEIVIPLLQEDGITLDIIEFGDYVRPNLALEEGELDANFFQHVPYLQDFNQERGSNLVALVGIHVEPLGIYSEKISSLEELPSRAQIAIPNDVTNGGRALLLLQAAGLIKVDEKAGIAPTLFDITENKLNLRFHELEAAQLSRSLPDVQAAVINGNYALQANLNPIADALFLEGAKSPYVNVLVIRAGDEKNPHLLKLAEALTSEQVRAFILEKYEGGVVPTF